MREIQWVLARLLFYAYIGFSLFTVVGGYLTAPLMTYYFYGDWRFWRHARNGWKLLPHGWKMLWLIVRGDNHGFLFSVPLSSPPATAPDTSLVRLASTWEHGRGCGTCTRCCSAIRCPVLQEDTGLCGGYDSFFWRYFNCGRFPTIQSEIDYYGCPKWVIPQWQVAPGSPAYPIPTGEEALSAE